MLSKLEETIIKYPQEEKEFMLQLERMSKIDLIIYVNNLNNLRNILTEDIISKEKYIDNLQRVLGTYVEQKGEEVVDNAVNRIMDNNIDK
jgi:predicted sugar kinase